jgi:hypothetical protein
MDPNEAKLTESLKAKQVDVVLIPNGFCLGLVNFGQTINQFWTYLINLA